MTGEERAKEIALNCPHTTREGYACHVCILAALARERGEERTPEGRQWWQGITANAIASLVVANCKERIEPNVACTDCLMDMIGHIQDDARAHAAALEKVVEAARAFKSSGCMYCHRDGLYQAIRDLDATR